MTLAIVFSAWLLLVVVLSFALRVVEDREQMNRLVAAELEASKLYGTALGQRVEQLRRYRHDAAGLLRAIESALGETEGAARVHSGPVANAPAVMEGASLANAIVAFKRQQCAIAGIAFESDVEEGCLDFALKSGVDEGDMCAVLQNLLENAYEANLRVKDAPARFVRLAIGQVSVGGERPGSSASGGAVPGGEAQAGGGAETSCNAVTGGGTETGGGAEPGWAARAGGGAETDNAATCGNANLGGMRLGIVVENRMDSTETFSRETSKPDPQRHGVGLGIVEEVVSRYAGSYTIDFDEDAHTLAVTVVL